MGQLPLRTKWSVAGLTAIIGSVLITLWWTTQPVCRCAPAIRRPKVAVRVGSDEREVQIGESISGRTTLAREPRMAARRSCSVLAQMRKRSMMRSYVRGAWFTFYPSLLEPGTDWREGSPPASLRASRTGLDHVLPYAAHCSAVWIFLQR